MPLYFARKYREKYPFLVKEDLISLDNLTSITEITKKLATLLELPVEEYKVRETVSVQLHNLLKKYYPDCLLNIFGSSVNGFGVKNCDLDLLFLPYSYYSLLDQQTNVDKAFIPNPDDILRGRVPRDVLYQLDVMSQYRFLKQVFLKERSAVKKSTLLSDKDPTLKIQLHSNSRVHCDLHINDRVFLLNSELLQFLEKADPRIKPLVLTLCFWTRSVGFMKRDFFSNYAFILLVIFYLQNINPPILPSVQYLIEHAGFDRMSAGWQTAFSTDMNLIEKSQNTKTVGELLINFFDFYWNFDFVHNIVSPNSGKSLPIRMLKDSTDVRMKEFEISSLCIQDPFILSRNVCEIKKSIANIKLAFLTAHQMLHGIPGEYKFSMLFETTEYQKIFDLHYEKYLIGPSPTGQKFYSRSCFIYLDYDCIVQLSKNSTFSLQLWYEKVIQSVYKFLQHELLLGCEKTNSDKDLTTTSGEVKPKSENRIYDLELIQSFQCVVYSETRMGSKKFLRMAVKGDDCVRQLAQSKPESNPLMSLKCECYKHTCSQISDVIILFKPSVYSKEFCQISDYWVSRMPKAVKRILLSN